MVAAAGSSMRARSIVSWATWLSVLVVTGCGTTSETAPSGAPDAAEDSTTPTGDAGDTGNVGADAPARDSLAPDVGPSEVASDSAAPSDTSAPTDAVTDAPGDTTTASCAPAPVGFRPMAAAPTGGIDIGTYGFATWTGKELFLLRFGLRGGAEAVGAFAYDPVADTWRTLATPPFLLSFRGFAVWTWTGSQWLLYGEWPSGDSAAPGGFLYDPTTDTWSALDRPPVSARWAMMGAWDDAAHRLLMFGGTWTRHDGVWNEFSDGQRFDLATKTWTKIADAPFTGSRAKLAWSGGRLVVALPGRHLTAGDAITYASDVATYDPTSDAWTSLPSPPDDPNLFASARAMGPSNSDVALWFDLTAAWEAPSLPGAGRWWNGAEAKWNLLPAMFTPAPGTVRGGATLWSANGKLFAWGGYDVKHGGGSSTLRGDGASFDPSTGAVTPMPSAGAPSARMETISSWTGCDALLLGGVDDSGRRIDGRRFRPE